MFLTHPVKHGGGERLSKSLSQSKYDESFDKIHEKLNVTTPSQACQRNVIPPDVCGKHFLTAAKAT